MQAVINVWPQWGAVVEFWESDERRTLRREVAKLGNAYGFDYFLHETRTGGKSDKLWQEVGRLGYLGVAFPEEYGGGGGGISELSCVLEELAAAGCPLLMMVPSPAICGSIINRFGTQEQRNHWLRGFADGSLKMAFAITEPDAGSNTHRLRTIARRSGKDWVLSGQKAFVTGVDEADAILVVGRNADAPSDRFKPALFIVATNTPGLEFSPIDMGISIPENQFMLFLDHVRVPADALIGDENMGFDQVFAGLNPERIMASAYALGLARFALQRAVVYAKKRIVWEVPIGAHQGIAHPLAQQKIAIEMARLMMQKAAFFYDAGEDRSAGELANMAKYAGAEAAVSAADLAVQVHGGNGLSAEYGLSALLTLSRFARIAPVSREMILNFVAQHSLGLPKSY
ncbi:alkylation response protein AidB-like acyl-CoA dehydrogenase [Streptomyces sp. V4I23]|uniref:acyl-CoA dehydrogenase family protein n=1 Tax=Streptomyces sp. V4I23 TaxID=3042282 RepID=UPI00278B3199|nr:acyl-CoA dehydrogenase [Streptomyces sp. V4I23]MDQ1005638.1 alkylation response protein AidB-like acyl-CoA dehydrogenase [Streptomyces sp. V4I23]